MPDKVTLPVRIRGEQIGEVSWVRDPAWEDLPSETVWLAKMVWAVDSFQRCWIGYRTEMLPQPKFLMVTRAIVEALNGGKRNENRERDFQLLCISHFGLNVVRGVFR